jgi:hypothetical protein
LQLKQEEQRFCMSLGVNAILSQQSFPLLQILISKMHTGRSQMGSMQAQNPPQYRLTLEVETPPTVVEGEAFNIVYRVKNVGTAPFPGGHVTVELSWPSLDPKVYQPIVLSNPLAPGQEFIERGYSQAPLVAGYTWFHVYEAAASNAVPVIVLKGAAQLFPPQIHQQISATQATYMRIPAHAVRARTHEEISQEQQVVLSTDALKVSRVTLRWAIAAFAATVAFALLDLLLRATGH